MSYGYDPHSQDDGRRAPARQGDFGSEHDGAPAGRGRRRRAQGEPEAGQPYPYADQYTDSAQYEQHPYPQDPYLQAPYTQDPYAQPYAGPAAAEQYGREAYPEPQADPQWEQSGLGWERRDWDEAQRLTGPPSFAEPGYREPDRRSNPQPFPPRPAEAPQYAATDLADDPRDSAFTAASQPPNRPSPASAGRAAFGAAGIAVVIGITAVAALPVLALAVGMSQIGLAVGWFRTAGLSQGRRTVILVALVGLAATAAAYRLAAESAPGAIGGALGAGFVLLAADQLGRGAAAAHHRSESLALAVTGAAFAVLPAGFVVAQRQDSALATACALAAAVAVLCEALVGGGERPAGVLAGALAAGAVGTLTAASLSSAAGAAGGALGGLAAGLLAVVGARFTARLAADGADVRISSQVLPMAFAAIAAVSATTILR